MPDENSSILPYQQNKPTRRGMLRRRVFWFIGSAVGLALLIAGGWAYFIARLHADISAGFGPHAIHAVTAQGWSQLTVGMTRAQVIALLGEPGYRCANTTTGSAIPASDFWEYDWTDGLDIFSPSPKAFVVNFGPDGSVSSFRRPLAPAATQPAASSRRSG